MTITAIFSVCMSSGHVRPILGSPLGRRPSAVVEDPPGDAVPHRTCHATLDSAASRLTARGAHGKIGVDRQGRLEVKTGHSEEQAAAARRFGTNLRRLREARALSRDELARLSGVSADSIYRIETGRRLVKISTW